MTAPTNISALTISLGPDDYEEQRLLETVCEIAKHDARESERSLAFAKSAKSVKDAKLDLDEVVRRLGYNPLSGPRPQRARGRARDDAMPNPLPLKGTVLTSCLGEEYTVLGYAKWPRKVGLGFDVILYEDAKGDVVARGVTHLFAGTLASGIPFVTWDSDPRGLKAEQPIPMNKRRSLTKRDLKADRDARDEDLRQFNATKHKRY